VPAYPDQAAHETLQAAIAQDAKCQQAFADASGLGVHALAFDKSLTREPGRSAALRVRNQVCNTDQELSNNYLQFRLVVRRLDSVALPGGI